MRNANNIKSEKCLVYNKHSINASSLSWGLNGMQNRKTWLLFSELTEWQGWADKDKHLWDQTVCSMSHDKETKSEGKD